jgi:hypothetical protein
MGYAKSLGNQYNASTAWSSLGTDQGAYQRSNLANTLSPIRDLALPAFSEYSTSGPRRSNPYEQEVMEDVFDIYQGSRRKLSVPPILTEDLNNMTFGLLERFAGVPEGFANAAIAGKYFNKI